ncbi:hypothetical protein BKE30_15425 [Alkanindiges hydrocarboniclasticus]|uniref:Uncharacterized protein n=1 Tax=Alkanindiges hydrocarboniclasticus TaxID=1907941 RepID=A0A1S8CQH8_9GAMM|nr:hypothetical protein [Alkanindiges hydrocarboniclasticus]ONG37031.1 hypothetical protein BKE30_15425 [Alkanindiges hydrocarboniclasticus]
MKKPSNQNVAAGLIPARLLKKESHPDFPKLKVTYPFEDDDQLTLSFKEVVAIVAKAREVGQLEATDKLTEEYIRRELKLVPIVGTIGDGCKNHYIKPVKVD